MEGARKKSCKAAIIDGTVPYVGRRGEDSEHCYRDCLRYLSWQAERK